MSQTKEVTSESLKTIVRFFYRRFRNAFLIMTISLCFVIVHCHLEERWTRRIHYKEQSHFSLNRIGKRSFGSFNITGRWNPKIILETLNINKNGKPNPLIAADNEINSTMHMNDDKFRKRKNETAMSTAANASHVPRPLSNSSMKKYKDTSTELKTKHLLELTPESGLNQKSRRFWLEDFTFGLPKNLHDHLQDILLRDFERNDTKRCPRGYFRLRDMKSCHKWLKCDETMALKGGDIYGNGVGKIVRSAEWKNKYNVAVVSLREDRYRYQQFVSRVQSGVDNMILAQSSPYVTQVVGLCNRGNNTVMVMEGCKMGNFRTFYCTSTFRHLSVFDKFKIAIQMVAEFDYLHRGLGLPRVHCDLHTVMQAFGQFLVSDDRRLFLNDLDEIPSVNKKNNTMATCQSEPMGIMEQPGFLAPEMRYTQAEFDEGKSRKPVDEASDVWKIPDLTANIMVVDQGTRKFEILENSDFDYYYKSRLKQIHDQCKQKDPTKRPSSRDILIRYLNLYDELLNSSSN